MKIVIVNHVHPGRKHVSSLRSWSFAKELAKRGHKVIQLCEWEEEVGEHIEARKIIDILDSHKWQEPLVISVKPSSLYLLSIIRSKEIPGFMRKFLVMAQYILSSGVFTDFSNASVHHEEVLSKLFEPEMVWGIFGNTECWIIAQRLAKMSSCEWVGDMKDSWEVFIRKPLRRLLAMRFRNMYCCTANCYLNKDSAEKWLKKQCQVVYSGINKDFSVDRREVKDTRVFIITITGSVYNELALKEYIKAIKIWIETKDGYVQKRGIRVRLIYAGGDGYKVSKELKQLEHIADLSIRQYLPLKELAGICCEADVNSYIKNYDGFHHKLIELLSCGKDILAFPGESIEAKDLANRCAGSLHSPRTKEEVIEALNKVIGRSKTLRRNNEEMRFFSWQTQTEILEKIFLRAKEERE